MKIKVTDLEEILTKVISKLKKEGVDEISFATDFYRLIPTESWDDYSSSEVDSCSLFDDIEELLKLTENKDRFCTYVDFDRVSSVLRAISQEQNPIVKLTDV